jgi:hypothetical protein
MSNDGVLTTVRTRGISVKRDYTGEERGLAMKFTGDERGQPFLDRRCLARAA